MYPVGVAGVRTTMLTLASRLRVRLVESGPADGAPLILIHGWGACVYTFRYAIDALARTGRRVIAFDLRGHGLSDKPVARGEYTTDALVGDVRDVLDTLQIQRADILGHSLGGGVALQFALAHAARIRRLVLVAPVGLTKIRLPAIGHFLTPRFSDRFARHLTPRWLTTLLLRSTYGDQSRVTERDVDEYWAPSQFPDYYRAARALLEEFDWRALGPRQLSSIDSLTLVILSTADRLIRDADAPAGLIPRSAVIDLVGAGHLGVEECATECNRAVANFLAAQ
jgi:pimeloyl-ACP methyl ester carboxylesterase